MNRLRIAILTHSTNPRGGVAHCLALGEALCALGHEAVVHAPDPSGRGFYRAASCPVVSVAAGPVAGGTVDLVRTRINDYLRHFGSPAACDFDLFHAHDGIGGNALATLRHRRRISGYVRTVHHLDTFAEPALADWEERSIQEAQALLCVSRTWAERLRTAYGVQADIVGNGVDLGVYRPEADATDAGARAHWGLGAGPVVLSVGGFEARKNTATLIEAFATLRARHPGAQLLVVGGASLLDHAAYRARCDAILADRGLAVGPGCAVVETGPVPQAEMPALYRLADLLALPSWTEGFGLCVLEAMACGTPVLVSAGPPFTEYLGAGDALFVDPADPDGLALAMARALAKPVRRRLRAAGYAVARTHSWRACAERHLPTYQACLRPEARLPVEILSPPRSTMPEMRFHVRWPDGRREACYSPSLVIKDYFAPGETYPLDDFVAKARTALTIASERVREKYGFACSSALDQLGRIEAAASVQAPDGRVTVEAFEP